MKLLEPLMSTTIPNRRQYILLNYTEMDIGYDQRHGGAYDRGSADAYYGRNFEPHFYTGATYMSDRVPLELMTAQEITAYTAGYKNTEQRKDYGSF